MHCIVRDEAKVIIYISFSVSIFYGTENEIWAGFGPVGSTEKKIFWANYEQLLRAVFLCFHEQNKLIFLKTL